MDSILYDVRQAYRSLARRPGFVAVGVASLALGIAVNVAVFSVMSAILLPPPGVPDASRLVMVGMPTLTAAQLETLTDALAPEGDVFATAGPQGAVAIGDDLQRAPLEVVSGRYFDALGLRATAGRLLTPGDAQAGDGVPAIVVSHSLWRRRFGGDPALVGAVVRFGAGKARVRGAQMVYTADVWSAVPPDARRPAPWNAFVRLRPAVDLDGGRSAVEAAVRRLPGLAPEAARDVRVTTVQHLERVVWAIVGLFMLVPGLVLLVACANVAGLFASRSEERRQEIAVRMALGGSRRRLLRQLLLEGALLALAAAGAGLLLSRLVVSAVSPWVLPTLADYSMFPEIALDGRAVGVALGCAALAALASSLLPALSAVRADVNAVLKRAPVQWGRRRVSLRDVLVVGQLVVTFAFLAAAAVCVNGIRTGLRASFGFAPERVLVATLAAGPSARAHPGALTNALVDVRDLPGVARATIATVPPGAEGPRVAVGRADAPDRPAQEATFSQVRPDYFALAGTRLLRGRFLDERDVNENRAVAVVSAALARALWDDDPVGRALRLGDGRTVEVVGVAADAVRLATIDRLPAASTQPFLFLPLADASLVHAPSVQLLLEGRDADTGRLGPEVERLLRARHPGLSVVQSATVAELNRRGLVQYDLMSALLLVLGAGCAVLGGVGLYATVARAVLRRSREIGVRRALGASPAAVVRLVLRSSGGLALAGVALGVPAALAAQGLLRAAIFGLPPLGAGTLATVAALVASVTAAASYVPVRRAARVDPAVVLRSE
jgi:putative ABC transport system permease protein